MVVWSAVTSHPRSTFKCYNLGLFLIAYKFFEEYAQILNLLGYK